MQLSHPIKNLYKHKKIPPREIYNQLCATCHGSLRKGRIGPDITVKRLRAYTQAELVDLLKFGKKGSVMPAYLQEKGGMLSHHQIEALVRYLKEDSKVSSSL